ncbi:MAG: decarboxylating 6-phosphogluconate dehydrogenase [Candidatus Palauibacterales bacterium]|nr:decarboxylating 6-phosphogluconate dehydrogenase [Candidatus Palauibacterales bacterium]MDP2529808.1 decarboxylating 6-phosphogluconate dehydrogenase [Candidatus Palauibacterales bacterium]MDP2582865.1 decarboxylating 6-phosphogluconate dehydrogenase [Candidatus Palauibacterales bacterium]
MKMGLIGLGRMGGNMVRRLVQDGHDVVGYDLAADNVKQAEEAGAEGADSLEALVEALETPRVVWVMVPHGEPTRSTIEKLLPHLETEDILIDGGNSHYTDSIAHAKVCAERGIHFLDIGVSGGVWGLKIGYCMMIGGPHEAFERVEPILSTLAPEDGYAHVGPSGAGHFVKMVHNAIEYAMLQAIGEGFGCLDASDWDLDLKQIASVWRHGSVIRCWLLELLEDAFEEEGNDLGDIAPYVDDSGTGRWTVDYALEKAVPVPAIATALFERFDSRTEERFAYRTIAALRNQFGGHAVRKE